MLLNYFTNSLPPALVFILLIILLIYGVFILLIPVFLFATQKYSYLCYREIQKTNTLLTDLALKVLSGK